ncbi:MAG: hypothetical protein ABFQ82_02405 [Thermodesulfobacteriota bacterium]
MEFRKHCCKFAALAAIVAILLVSFLRGYDILDWALLSWLGATIVVVAAWLCMKCRDDGSGDEQGGKGP